MCGKERLESRVSKSTGRFPWICTQNQHRVFRRSSSTRADREQGSVVHVHCRRQFPHVGLEICEIQNAEQKSQEQRRHAHLSNAADANFFSSHCRPVGKVAQRLQNGRHQHSVHFESGRSKTQLRVFQKSSI